MGRASRGKCCWLVSRARVGRFRRGKVRGGKGKDGQAGEIRCQPPKGRNIERTMGGGG